MRIVSKRGLLLASSLAIAALSTGALIVQARHRVVHGHFAPFGLHADAVSVQTSIGIPGQTHLYWVELTNFGGPASFVACDYVTDTLGQGTEYAYGVQRWDAAARAWDTVSLPDPEWFCRPAPLSRIEAGVVRRTIWPGQSVRVMEFEAVGARDAFRKGEIARFVVFRAPFQPVDWRAAVPSDGFRIEDDVVHSSPVPYRLRH